MTIVEPIIRGLVSISNRLLSSHYKLKLFMIVLEKMVRAATHTPINFNYQTGHGDLLIKADKSQVQIGWQLPEENPECEHDISNQNAKQDHLDQHDKQENTDNSHIDCNQPLAIFSRFVDEMIRSTSPACDKHAAKDRVQEKGVSRGAFRR